MQAEIERWRRADDAVAALGRASAAVRRYRATPPAVSGQLDRLAVREVRLAITRTIEGLQRLELRIGRPTICIGVSGPPRTGKSTLLQSMTGLPATHLPTNDEGPATAVRCGVRHWPGRRRAVLDLHTFDSFRAAHLRMRYAQAGLGEPPVDIEAFRAAAFAVPGHPDRAPVLAELRRMQRALWSYEELLDRSRRVLELVDDDLRRLREYIAYPAAPPDDGAHRYLAVRSARIECAFPHAELGGIDLVDLPGLAEGRVGEQHHAVAGLRQDVDLVLLVVPAGSATVVPEPATLAVLDQLRGLAGRRQDFVVIVRNANPGAASGPPVVEDRRRYRILEVDARRPDDVADRLVRPVLAHLLERLPAMDGELLARTAAGNAPAREELVRLAVQTRAVLRQVRPGPGAAERLHRRADELTRALAASLHGVASGLRDRSATDAREYRAAVVAVGREVGAWVGAGLGVGPDRWRSEALRAMTGDGFAAFAQAQFARVREELAGRYAALDGYLRRRLEQTWTQVGAAVSGQLGGLIGEGDGGRALAELAEVVDGVARPCPLLRQAVADLLDLRLDYRTHLLPRVWASLDPLVASPAPPDDGRRLDEAAGELFRLLCERAERAAWRIRRRLLREDSLPGHVVLAAVERFTGALVGSDPGRRELRELAWSYRAELWAGEFADLDRADARVARLDRAADDLLALATELGRPGADRERRGAGPV